MAGFTLDALDGAARTFPSGRPALLCFVKEDCPTCGLSMPLIEAAYRAFGGAADVLAIGQDREGNAALVERHQLAVPMLDDSA
ncbi:MAG: peroxiredoxin family protein, partial [Candidatus Binataceae bacterium]